MADEQEKLQTMDCPICGTTFVPKRYSPIGTMQRFCSPKCARQQFKTEHPASTNRHRRPFNPTYGDLLVTYIRHDEQGQAFPNGYDLLDSQIEPLPRKLSVSTSPIPPQDDFWLRHPSRIQNRQDWDAMPCIQTETGWHLSDVPCSVCGEPVVKSRRHTRICTRCKVELRKKYNHDGRSQKRKLTDLEISELRRLYPHFTYYELCKRFGVSSCVIKNWTRDLPKKKNSRSWQKGATRDSASLTPSAQS